MLNNIPNEVDRRNTYYNDINVAEGMNLARNVITLSLMLFLNLWNFRVLLADLYNLSFISLKSLRLYFVPLLIFIMLGFF